MKGFVYILFNRSYPGCVKVGKAKSPKLRLKQLNGTTGVLWKFTLEAYFKVSDYTSAEQDAHEILKEYRVKSNKEFFRLSVQDAIQKLSSIFGPPKYCRANYLKSIEISAEEIRQKEEDRIERIRHTKEQRTLEAMMQQGQRREQIKKKLKLFGLSLLLSCALCVFFYYYIGK